MAVDVATTDDPVTELSSDPADTSPESGRGTLRGSRTTPRLAVITVVLLVGGLSALTAWLGHLAFTEHAQQQRDSAYLATSRQAALDLTTIDYTRVDADVARIVDGSTGAFRDDFVNRAEPFKDVVRQAQSKSQGRIVDAGIVFSDAGHAQVLVAVDVTTTRTASKDTGVRAWAMRISVESDGAAVKVNDVEFVS